MHQCCKNFKLAHKWLEMEHLVHALIDKFVKRGLQSLDGFYTVQLMALLFKLKVVYCTADGFVVQSGDQEGPGDGFIDPSTEKFRTIPLEIMVEGEKEPVYGVTLEG